MIDTLHLRNPSLIEVYQILNRNKYNASIKQI